jgi:hypothetical protein
MQYDIIGDVHGHADALEELLLKLGYCWKTSGYRADGRKAVFVGDLIDRGTQNRRVIEVVRNMVDAGDAITVMGNHEYNAICYHTVKKGSEGDWLRPHERSKFKQHQNFLKEYPLGHTETDEVINWFKRLPLYIDDEKIPFRVVHACWDQEAIDALMQKGFVDGDGVIDNDDFWKLSTDKKNVDPFSPYKVIETILKGPEIKLPKGDDSSGFQDKDGKPRDNIRVRWWGPRSTYRNQAFGYQEEYEKFPQIAIPPDIRIPVYDDLKPVFFGHYWQRGTPVLQDPNICCVDYSAGLGEKLVCYSLANPDSLDQLSNDHFSWAGTLR